MAARRQSSTSSLGRYARQTDAELELENRSLDFCNAFWGLNDPGVEVLFARMRYAAKTIEDLRMFWRERAAIEDEYAKRLVKLSKTALGKDEIGELRGSLETLRVETERQAGQHLQLSIAIRKDLETPTAEFAAKQANHRKTFQANVEKTFKAKQAQETYVAKAKERYEQDCHRVNSYTAQQTLVQGRELERIMLKLDRAQSTVQANERDYANYTKVLADTVQKWDVEWKNFCDQCQDLEEERIEFMKDNVWAYANAVSTVCVAEDDSCEKIRLSLEQLEVEKDLQLFVSQYGTGSNIPEAPPFINYTIADVNQPKPTTRPANFARSSTRQSLMAQVMNQTQQQDEDLNDSGNAGVGSGGRSHSQASSHSRRGTVNGSASPGNPTAGSALPTSGSQYNNVQQVKHQITSSVSSTSQFAPPPSAPNGQPPYRSDSSLGGQPGPGNAPSGYGSDHTKGVQSIGGPGDPLAAQLEALRTGGSGTIRRTTTASAKVPSETHKPPSSAQGSANRPISPVAPTALSPPPGSVAPVNYSASAEAIVGAHPSTSRPSSPVAPHAAMMKRNSVRSTSPLPVEDVVSQYHPVLPGERRLSRDNSVNSPQQRGRPDERGGRATSPGPGGSGGFAGVGAQGRSPSPSFRGRGPSPSRAPSPGLQGPPTVAAPRTASPLGIALDATGNVSHDAMAEAFKARQQSGYTAGAPAPQQTPIAQPVAQQPYGPQTGRPGYYGAVPPAPPPTTQPPPPPVGGYGGQSGYGGGAPPPMSQYSYQAPNPAQPMHQPPPNGYAAPTPQNNYTPQQQNVNRGGYQQQYQAPAAAPIQTAPQLATAVPAQRPMGQQQQMQAPAQNPVQQQRAPSPQPQSVPPTRSWIDNQPVLFYVKALYDYTATIDEEFDFQAGDVIAVTATPEDGWWSGILLDDTRRVPGRNVFPSNFVCLF